MSSHAPAHHDTFQASGIHRNCAEVPFSGLLKQSASVSMHCSFAVRCSLTRDADKCYFRTYSLLQCLGNQWSLNIPFKKPIYTTVS